jgi:hypothetical protein
MNPNPPINQALIGIYQGNAAAIAARVDSFTDSRAHLRKWHLPSYPQAGVFVLPIGINQL